MPRRRTRKPAATDAKVQPAQAHSPPNAQCESTTATSSLQLLQDLSCRLGMQAGRGITEHAQLRMYGATIARKMVSQRRTLTCPLACSACGACGAAAAKAASHWGCSVRTGWSPGLNTQRGSSLPRRSLQQHTYRVKERTAKGTACM